MFYALVYHFTSQKSANAISKDKDSLMKLHFSSIADDDCYYHHYKDSIKNITCEPIKCYIFYKCKLELLNDNNINNIPNGKFYALNKFPFTEYTDEFDEILVYMSDEDHKMWQSYPEKIIKNDLYVPLFCIELISDFVQPDTYYAEGIMNA